MDAAEQCVGQRPKHAHVSTQPSKPASKQKPKRGRHIRQESSSASSSRSSAANSQARVDAGSSQASADAAQRPNDDVQPETDPQAATSQAPDIDPAVQEGMTQQIGRVPSAAYPAEVQAPDRSGRKLRVALIILIVLTLIGAAAFAALIYVNSNKAKEVALEANKAYAERSSVEVSEAVPLADAVAKMPDIKSLLGMSRTSAVEALGADATVIAVDTVSQENAEEAAGAEPADAEKTVVKLVTVQLPADSSATKRTPEVFLELNANDTVVSASYAIDCASLGSGPVRFVDAIGVNHVIDRALSMAGVTVGEGTITAPEDVATYTQYGQGVIVSQSTSFSGQCSDGAATWKATLTYDYAAANASGSLGDTLRTVLITFTVA